MDTRVVSLLDQAADMRGIPPGLIDDLAVQKDKATTRYASYRRLKNAVKKVIADRDKPVVVVDDYDVDDLGGGYASLEDINAPKKPAPRRPAPVEAVKKEDLAPADTPLDENGLPTELNDIMHDIYGDDIPDDVIQIIPSDDEQGEENGEYKKGHLDIAEPEPEPEPKRKPDWPIVVDDPDPGLKTEGNNEMTDTSKIHPSYYLRIRMYGDMFRGEHDGYTKSFRTPDECAIYHWNNRVVKDED